MDGTVPIQGTPLVHKKVRFKVLVVVSYHYLTITNWYGMVVPIQGTPPCTSMTKISVFHVHVPYGRSDIPY